MNRSYEVDIDRAQEILDLVQKWGDRPEIKKDLVPARMDAYNSFVAMILTGTVAGIFPNTPEFNRQLLDKLAIAFDCGYYARANLQSRRG